MFPQCGINTLNDIFSSPACLGSSCLTITDSFTVLTLITDPNNSEADDLFAHAPFVIMEMEIGCVCWNTYFYSCLLLCILNSKQLVVEACTSASSCGNYLQVHTETSYSWLNQHLIYLNLHWHLSLSVIYLWVLFWMTFMLRGDMWWSWDNIMDQIVKTIWTFGSEFPAADTRRLQSDDCGAEWAVTDLWILWQNEINYNSYIDSATSYRWRGTCTSQ